MKAIKIFLAIFVLAAICTGIFLWVQSSQDPAKAKAPENQFTKKIQDEIEQLKGKPDNAFCKEFYSLVTSHINDFYKPLPPT
ncbi:MAG: hypothetical protein KKA07_03150, partial [Bacteroidetes bacterium]|nr:hypothetical protein [Bacteroidota bacterium]